MKTINVPTSLPDNVLSVSGGWDAAPRTGGIITFRGGVSILGNWGSGKTISLPFGTFYVTGKNEKLTADGLITNLNINCVLGRALERGITAGIGSCYKYGSDIPLGNVINHLGKLCGLPSIPIPGSVASILLKETLWLNEGESVISKLSELLSSVGVVAYSKNGATVQSETIGTFILGFKGSESNNTIDSSNTLTMAKEPSAVSIRGAEVIIEPTPLNETLTWVSDRTELLAGANSYDFNWTKKTTTIKRDFSTRLLEVTDLKEGDFNIYEKTVTKMSFELPEQPSNSLPDSHYVVDCYPYDPGRMLTRETIITRKSPPMERSMWQEFFTSVGYPDDSKYPGYTPPSLEAKCESTIVRERWEYNTQRTEVLKSKPSLDTMLPYESVKYTKVESRLKGLINPRLASITFGQNFLGIGDDDEARKALIERLIDELLNNWDVLQTYEIAEYFWSKGKGSPKWYGSKSISRPRIAIDGEYFQSKMKKFRLELDELDPPFDEYIDKLVEFRLELQEEMLTILPVSEESREGWEPEIPSESMGEEYERIRIPFEYTIGGTGTGGIISLSAGMVPAEVVEKVGYDLLSIENAKGKSKSVTDLDDFYYPGSGDSPSISIASDGVKSSVTFYNGA